MMKVTKNMITKNGREVHLGLDSGPDVFKDAAHVFTFVEKTKEQLKELVDLCLSVYEIDTINHQNDSMNYRIFSHRLRCGKKSSSLFIWLRHRSCHSPYRPQRRVI